MPLTTRRSFSLCLAGLVAVTLGACGSSSLSEGSSSSTSAAAVTVDPALVAKLPAKVKSAGTIVVGTDATYKPTSTSRVTARRSSAWTSTCSTP